MTADGKEETGVSSLETSMRLEKKCGESLERGALMVMVEPVTILSTEEQFGMLRSRVQLCEGVAALAWN